MKPENATRPDQEWERRRLNTGLLVELAGLRLIRDRGIDNVTVEQVAADVRISARTFYRYFKNVPDLLNAVPGRTIDETCRLVRARPATEGVLEAFRAVFEHLEARSIGDVEDGDVHGELLRRWGEIVRREPDAVRGRSHVLTVMTDRYKAAIADRLGVAADEDPTPGIFASALAGVVWFVYVQWLEQGSPGSLPRHLEEAFERLGELHRDA